MAVIVRQTSRRSKVSGARRSAALSFSMLALRTEGTMREGWSVNGESFTGLGQVIFEKRCCHQLMLSSRFGQEDL